MMRRFALLFLAVFCLAAPASFAWERGLSVAGKKADRVSAAELYSWRNDVFGDVNVEGMVLDLDGEAGFSTKNRMGLQFSFALSDRTNLSLEYNSFENSGTINKTVTFDNVNYAANAALDLKLSWFDGCAAYNLSRSDEGFFDFLYGIKVSKASLDVTGRDATTGITKSDGYSSPFPIPYIGIGGAAHLSDSLWVDGHLKYIGVNAGGANVRSTDFDINLGLDLTKKAQRKDTDWILTVGYRNFLIHGEKDNDTLNIGYRGPTFGIVARWF